MVDYPAGDSGPPSNVDGTGTECPAGKDQNNNCIGGLTPMVDTGNVAIGQQPTGGPSAFRTLSGPIPSTANNFPATPPSGGLVAGVVSFDTPGWSWFLSHPTTLNGWGSTGGTVSFREFMVAYSTTFPQTYAALNFANWTITVVGSGVGSIWKNTGTGLTGDASFQQLGGATVQALGNSYVRQSAIAYKP